MVLSALIDGLQADLIQKTVGRSPHIVISNAEYASTEAAKTLDGKPVLLLDATQKTSRPIVEWRSLAAALAADRRIETVLPVVEGSGLIQRGQVSRAILLRGMDLEQADGIYAISQSIIAGNPNAPEGAVLIGKNLAEDLGVTAGDPIQLELSGRESLTVMLDGVFDLGSSAINQRWLIVDQRQAALLGRGSHQLLRMQVYDVCRRNLAGNGNPSAHLSGGELAGKQRSSAFGFKQSKQFQLYHSIFVLLAVTSG